MSSIVFYKPTPTVKGSGAAFSCRPHRVDKNYQFYMNIIRQVGWDAQRKIASFKSNDTNNEIAVKFNVVELGRICRALAKKEAFDTVHRFNETSTSIRMGWTDYRGKPIFSISVSQNGEKYGIGLDANEAYVVSKFCDDAILKLCQDVE